MLTLTKEPVNRRDQSCIVDVLYDKNICSEELEKKFRGAGFFFNNIYNPNDMPELNSCYTFYKDKVGGYVTYPDKDIKLKLHLVLDPPRKPEQSKIIFDLLQRLPPFKNMELRYAP